MNPKKLQCLARLFVVSFAALWTPLPIIYPEMRASAESIKGQFDETRVDIKAMANQAEKLRVEGKYTNASEVLQRLRVIAEEMLGPGHPEVATILNSLGLVYIHQGLYLKAERFVARSLEIREATTGLGSALIVDNLNNLAYINTSLGRFSEAESFYSRSLLIAEKSLGAAHPAYANIVANLADLYYYRGQYAKAEFFHAQALAAKEKAFGREHWSIAISLNSLGLLYAIQGNFNKAESSYLRAIEIAKKVLGPEHPEFGSLLLNLAELYKDKGLFAKAETMLFQALAIQRRVHGVNHWSVAASLSALASIYSERRHYDKAEKCFLQALSIYEAILGRAHPDVRIFLRGIVAINAERRNYGRAFSALKETLEIELNWLAGELPLLADQARSAQLRQLGNAWEFAFALVDRHPSATQLALETRLNRQGLLAEIEQRQAVLANATGAERDKAQQMQALTQQLASVALPSDHRTAIREQRDRLQAELYRQYPDLQIQAVTTAALAEALPTDGVLVEFQRYRPFDGRKPTDQRWGSAQYLALILKPNGAISAVQLGPAAPIDATIHKGLSASAQDQKDAEAIWAQLSDQVLRPLLPQLNGSRQWFLSPDGELNRVPFAALPAPQQPKTPLAKAVLLRVLTTGRELVRLQQASRSGGSALVMANPSYDRKDAGSLAPTTAVAVAGSQRRSADLGKTDWQPLPGTQQEGQQVANLLGTGLISGGAATTTALQRQQGPRVMHVATHGFFVADQDVNPSDPLRVVQEQAPQLQALRGEDPQLRSGLVLAGANQPAADPKDDGLLTAAEALLLNLKGTELVTLSACSTGQGDVRTGEGVYGLQRALTVAGARSTLLSLWKVDDAATAEFMARFYKRLKAGEGRSDALAAVQKDFRDGLSGKAEWKEPYYWAAWQLVGDWRPIKGL